MYVIRSNLFLSLLCISQSVSCRFKDIREGLIICYVYSIHKIWLVLQKMFYNTKIFNIFVPSKFVTFKMHVSHLDLVYVGLFDTTPISMLPQKLEILSKNANNYKGRKKYCFWPLIWSYPFAPYYSTCVLILCFNFIYNISILDWYIYKIRPFFLNLYQRI